MEYHLQTNIELIVGMIHYVKRKDLDLNKYDACINNAINSRIYGYSWYLDIVADNWDVLVLNVNNLIPKKYVYAHIVCHFLNRH